MDWFREHFHSRLDRLFVVLGALCVPLALALARVRSYTMVDPYGHAVRTRAYARYGPFWKILLTLLLVVAGVRLLIHAVGWVRRGAAGR